MSSKILKVHPKDDMIVALQDLSKGDVVNYEDESFELISDVAAKHKFAVKDFEQGEELIMYGVLVGKASRKISRGELIHTGNLHHAASEYTGKSGDFKWDAPNVEKWKDKTFQGYKRKDGKVGTVNYWLFVPTDFCENRNLEFIKEA